MKLNSLPAIVIVATAGLASTNSFGETITVDISGYSSWGFQGDPQNETAVVMFCSGQTLTNISWDLNLTTVGFSWAEELTIGLQGNFEQIYPAFGDAFTVSNMNYQGSQATAIVLGSDGMLDVEFYETGFDDNANAIDSYFEAGSTISFSFNSLYPTPGTLALFSFAGLSVSRRRR